MTTGIKAIIFDLYGVLALNGWESFKVKYFSSREDVWHAIFELGRKVDAGLAEYAELVRFTAEQAGVSEATVRHEMEHTLPNKDLLAYIQTELRPHFRLGILSNARNDKVISQIFTPEEVQMFDVIAMSWHTGVTKPTDVAYHAIAKRLGVPEATCMYIDDRKHHVEGAQAAGMHAFLYVDFMACRRELEALLRK